VATGLGELEVHAEPIPDGRLSLNWGRRTSAITCCALYRKNEVQEEIGGRAFLNCANQDCLPTPAVLGFPQPQVQSMHSLLTKSTDGHRGSDLYYKHPPMRDSRQPHLEELPRIHQSSREVYGMVRFMRIVRFSLFILF